MGNIILFKYLRMIVITLLIYAIARRGFNGDIQIIISAMVINFLAALDISKNK